MRLALSKDGRGFDKQKTVPTPQSFKEAVTQLKLISSELSEGEKIKAAVGGARRPHNTILPDWVNKPLKEELENALGSPVFLENDTALVGLGEAVKGAGRVHAIVAYVTVSTGVGGVRIVNSRIDQNALGFEPGHQVIVVDGALCGCGGKGHLESYVSGSAIERTYRQKPEAISDPSVWDELAKYLAIGLNNTIVHWSPEVVVLGGSMIVGEPGISIEKVQSYLGKTLRVFPECPKLVKAELGDSGGLYGALLFLEQVRQYRGILG